MDGLHKNCIDDSMLDICHLETLNRSELTMRDIIKAINSCKNEFLITVSFGEGEAKNGKKESI